ncbi:MAG: NAD(P)-binding domain-containing protein [Saprospiraceae bacterium]
MKKVGIIGSGAVAKALAKGFVDQNYKVMVGSGDADKLSEIKRLLSVETGSFEEAAAFGDILVLCVKGSVAIKVFSGLSEQNVKGKIIIDTTNPIAETPPVNGVLQYFTKQNDSLAAQLQKAHPLAHIVKAFNSVGSGNMYKPAFTGGQPTMFICGDHLESNAEVMHILTLFGWDTQDMGTIESAGTIESLAILWCIRGFKDGQWNHALKLLI